MRVILRRAAIKWESNMKINKDVGESTETAL